MGIIKIKKQIINFALSLKGKEIELTKLNKQIIKIGMLNKQIIKVI